ncbi:MAG TPA: hypothetical protein VNX68_15265 [Nitrosopumilaceae archaeon]|nr:hypothetical protein [Nitrosopumilaceae archaeon]
MSKTVQSDRTKILSLACVAAVTTVIAGILHILLVPHSMSDEQGQGILFLVGGILQIFWAVPVIKGWNKMWQYVGIGGTAVLVILWFSTHVHGLTQCRGLGGMTLPLEIAQLMFIGLCIVLLKIRPTIQKGNTTS